MATGLLSYFKTVADATRAYGKLNEKKDPNANHYLNGRRKPVNHAFMYASFVHTIHPGAPKEEGSSITLPIATAKTLALSYHAHAVKITAAKAAAKNAAKAAA